MNSFNRALALTLAVSVALPFQLFANTQIQSIEKFDELLEKLPPEVKVLGVLTEKDAEFYDSISKPIGELTPIGRAIENRKTKSTLQFVCLQDIAKIEDCTKFQMRKDGENVVGPKFIIKVIQKETLALQLKEMIKNKKSNREWRYKSINDWSVSTGIHSDDIAVAGLCTGAAGFVVAAFMTSGTELWWTATLLAIAGGAIAPILIASVVVGTVAFAIFGQRNIVKLKMAIQKRKLDKAFKALMDGSKKITKPYRVSNKNFEFIQKSFN